MMNLDFVSQLGFAAVFCVGVIVLYRDMRADSTKREDKLLDHLDRVADTLDRIDDRLENMECRITSLEGKIQEGDV